MIYKEAVQCSCSYISATVVVLLCIWVWQIHAAMCNHIANRITNPYINAVLPQSPSIKAVVLFLHSHTSLVIIPPSFLHILLHFKMYLNVKSVSPTITHNDKMHRRIHCCKCLHPLWCGCADCDQAHAVCDYFLEMCLEIDWNPSVASWLYRQ